MTRIKRGVFARKKRKTILKATKGYLGARSKKYRAAKQAFIKAGRYAFRDRRAKKRMFRRGWILKLNAALRARGLTYSKFIPMLKKSKIDLDRKILAELACYHPKTFEKIIEKCKNVL